MTRRPQTCRCDAYPFPHRKDGGKCDRTQQDLMKPEPTTEHWSDQAMRDAGHKPGDFA
jgi:hypothetical protein